MTGDNTLAEPVTEREVIITRVLNAPRELVWKAWTDPHHVAQWWGPKGFVSVGCEMDLHVGGVFQLGLRAPDGAIYSCRGTYREIVAPERIVYEGASDESHPCGSGLPPRAIVTVTFDEHDGRTTLTLRTLLASAADRAAAVREGYVEGWTSSLERLVGILEA